MNIEVTAQDVINHLRDEYLKLEGKEADEMLEKITFIHNVRSTIFYKRMKNDIMTNLHTIK